MTSTRRIGGMSGRRTALAVLGLAQLLAGTAPPQAFAQATPGPGPIAPASWLLERAGDPGVVVVQVETSRDAYERGHVPGARFLSADAILWDGPPGREWATELRPVAELERAFESVGVGDGVQVVLYSSRILTATRAWLTLDYLGHGDHASVLDGGLDAWRAAGGEVITAATTASSLGSLTPRPRDGMLVDAEWIRGRLDDPAVALVDARPEDEYTGADGGMGGMTKAGHIPGAVRLEWVELLGPDGRFLGLDEMRAKLAAVGAGDGKTMVSYCMVGLRASLNYLVARALGLDVRFYDGSWHDWGTRPGFPAVAGLEPGGGR